jgi:hypothetical protein
MLLVIIQILADFLKAYTTDLKISGERKDDFRITNLIDSK